jgi:integrase
MRDTKPKRNKRTERLSPDGKWRSFPKVPNLLQYCSTGLYFARLKVNGKLIRRSLTANTFEEAKLALHDFLSKEQKRRHVTGAPVLFSEARGLYEATLANDHTLSEPSRYYRRNCIKRLLKSWPDLDGMKLRAIIRGQCEAWSSKLAGEVDAQYFNNILGTVKAILDRGGIAHDGGSPLATIKRMGIVQAPPVLPEPEQFLKLVELMETSGAGQQQECADFARFLAYSGCRLSEARAATWGDVDLEAGFLTVHNAKVRRARNWNPTRRVPIIPDLRQLLERLKQGNPEATEPICKVGECQKSLTRACKLVGIAKLTHHDLRHLFATRCIEAGVDIPTVSRWLGHVDGGALAMRVYGHLRRKHSQAMAAMVTFSQSKPENVVALPPAGTAAPVTAEAAAVATGNP